jgi:hypothetical protein
MTDIAAQAAYSRAFLVAGVLVTIQRVQGFAPNVVTLASASVQAVVRNIVADSTMAAQAGLSGSAPGAVRQGDRLALVSANDLTNAGFPVPLVVGDQIVLPDSSEILDILRVDPYKRAFAGAVELICVGVS